MHLFGLILALDGESAGGSNTGLAMISVASMVFGWLLVGGLWFFVFREKAHRRREKNRTD
jgi:uncharacterized iron-regulated membrane protein